MDLLIALYGSNKRSYPILVTFPQTYSRIDRVFQDLQLASRSLVVSLQGDYLIETGRETVEHQRQLEN